MIHDKIGKELFSDLKIYRILNIAYSFIYLFLLPTPP